MMRPWQQRQVAPRRQQGISLVELALGLAIVGLLLAMTFKGQEVFEQYRQGQFVHMVRHLEATLRAHQKIYGRLPGDCNKDGWMDFELTDSSGLQASALDYTIADNFIAASSSTATYSAGLLCPESSLAPFNAAPNMAFNELKVAGLLPSGEPNRKSASHTLGGFAFLGTYGIAAVDTLESRFNAILLTKVSIASARRLAQAIDGGSGSAANLNRVRRITDDFLGFEPLWQKTGETEEALITIVVFFDRIPPLVAQWIHPQQPGLS